METMTSKQMADLYGLKSSTAFNNLMKRCGILLRTEKGYVLAPRFRNQGYDTAVTEWFFLPNGFKASKKRAAWTPKGRLFIQRHLYRLGIMPPAEQRNLFTN